jgi:cholesterol transport system auxiliary component
MLDIVRWVSGSPLPRREEPGDAGSQSQDTSKEQAPT